MKRISKAKRAHLLAVVRDHLCESCGLAQKYESWVALCTGCWRARFSWNVGRGRHSGHLRALWIRQAEARRAG